MVKINIKIMSESPEFSLEDFDDIDDDGLEPMADELERGFMILDAINLADIQRQTAVNLSNIGLGNTTLRLDKKPNRRFYSPLGFSKRPKIDKPLLMAEDTERILTGVGIKTADIIPDPSLNIHFKRDSNNIETRKLKTIPVDNSEEEKKKLNIAFALDLLKALE